MKETVGGMGQWTPADLTLLFFTVCNRLAHMFNVIEEGAIFPTAESVARAAFMAKEEGIELGPFSYRVLTMLPVPYRLYANIMLEHLQPWIAEWVVLGNLCSSRRAGSGRRSIWNGGKDGAQRINRGSMHSRSS